MHKILLIILLGTNLLIHAQKKINADLLIHNATIYTVDEQFSTTGAMIIRDGKILATGKVKDLKANYAATKEIDADGKYIYPGLIDAHAHFLGYGLGLQTVDLTGTKSWDEILTKLKNYAASHQKGWLIGRGWDQNDWAVKEFPTREKLDELFAEQPVFLTRVDGHAAIANKLALGNITATTKISGGEVIVKNGEPTGVLVDNAVKLVSAKIPAATTADKENALLNAQANCFAAGLTTIDDCGINYDDVLMIEAMQKRQVLKMRLYIMLSDGEQNYRQAFKRGIIKTDRLNVRAFKVYVDGALGSRGACLLNPYTDKPESMGFLMRSKEHYNEVASRIFENGFQMCTHAIGDSGNRIVLNTYANYLKGKNDLRWRIEHAQVVNSSDFKLFGKYSIIPSVQPTHATSDMYWAGDRLGTERIKGAYAYKRLMKENGWIPLGTDFPVEDISPLKTFYAACIRKDGSGWPAGGFQPENALTRQETLRGMTIWAAKANFEEKEKGSLEPGKFADFIIMDTDLMTVKPAKILTARVLQTYVNGEQVFVQK